MLATVHVLCVLVRVTGQHQTQTDPPPLPGVDGTRGATSAGLEREKPFPNVSGDSDCVPDQSYGPLVLLDLWHAEYRLTDSACKQSGAFYPFLAHLRDAFAIHDPALFQKAKDLWKKRHPTWTDRDSNDVMRTNYTNKVLKYVPRTVPPAPTLVERFDLLIEAFKNVRIAKTGTTHYTVRSSVEPPPQKKHGLRCSKNVVFGQVLYFFERSLPTSV